MPLPIRAELFFGAAHGVALSALIWSVALDPAPFNGTTALILAASVAAGALRARFRTPAGIDISYPWILAALWVQGLGISMMAALATAATSSLHRAPLRAAAELGRLLLAAATAGAVFLAVSSRMPAPAAAAVHAVTYVTMLVLYDRWSRRVDGRTARPPRARIAVGSVAAAGLTFAAGLGLALGFASPASEVLLSAGLLLASTLTLVASHRRERRERREGASLEQRFARSALDALATLVLSKDDRSRNHVARVRRLCLDVGGRMELTPNELKSLESAALLHDLGKLAIPEYILSKPGRLDRAEFERIQTHPDLGADVVERIPASHDVAAIIRHHHESWDGSGYPAGLAGEDIPLSARILTAVDNYDALTSDRPYRAALSHEEALRFLRDESDRIFDGLVVETLSECLAENLAWAADHEASDEDDVHVDVDGAGSIGALGLAQAELHALYEIARALGYGTDLEEFLALAATKLEPLVPHRSLVVYRLDPHDGLLRACFASGLSADRLRKTTIPLGERLSGWSAAQRRAHHGRDHRSPLHRDGFRSDLEEWADEKAARELGSALAAPMVAGDRCVGVLTLYDREDRQFLDHERNVLVRVASRLAGAFVRTTRPAPVDASLTDPSTGVPNARFLWLETTHRIGHSSAESVGFGLLAFRLLGIERVTEQYGVETTDDLVGRVARRFATSCEEGDTLVRFGPDLFMVLTAADEEGELTRRWHALASEVEQPMPLRCNRPAHQMRLCAAHAIFPDDGSSIEGLLRTLDERLAGSAGRGRTVVPFRATRERGRVPA